MSARLAKRHGIACSMAHSEKGKWEGHDERKEHTREEEGEARGSCTTGAFLLKVGHVPGICPYRSSPFLKVAHRASMILRACIICMTSFPENSSDEDWKHYTIQELRKASARFLTP